MMEWFRSGGFGMFAILAIGAGSVGFGIKAVMQPTRERVAMLRSLPGLIALAALCTFGTDLWAVNRFLSSSSVDPSAAAGIGLVGLTESAQALTLGGLMAMVVVVLRMLADAKKARGEAA